MDRRAFLAAIPAVAIAAKALPKESFYQELERAYHDCVVGPEVVPWYHGEVPFHRLTFKGAPILESEYVPGGSFVIVDPQIVGGPDMIWANTRKCRFLLPPPPPS